MHPGWTNGTLVRNLQRERQLPLAGLAADHSRPSVAEGELLRLAVDLGAADFGGALTQAEQELVDLVRSTPATPRTIQRDVHDAIVAGQDPLGERLSRIRPPADRRAWGAFYTPPSLVDPMLGWVLNLDPDRLIDPGCGSGRFAAGAARFRRDLPIVAVDLDPCATLLTRAALAVLGARAATVLQADYTAIHLPPITGRTAFVGNPPYVRHHNLSHAAKEWAVRAGRLLGQTVSALAGLHVHFCLATALYAQPGDAGCFVTSAEWLDVNYGAAVRHLLLNGLGGQSLHLIDPRAVPFEDAMTTAAVACFIVGSAPPSFQVQLVMEPAELRDLNMGRQVERTVLEQTQRWTPVISRQQQDSAAAISCAPLGIVARVHRGLVTGSNEFFVLTRQRAHNLGISEWCRPAITTAAEILQSGGVIRDGPERRVLLDIPADVDRSAYTRLDAYLRLGEQPDGAEPPIAMRYIPRHRRPWWYLGRITSPPIVASYMARQAPGFALNPDGLALLNIAHGIFPQEGIPAEKLVVALNAARDSFRGRGRTYQGGLEKFEPREMEALLIPVAALSETL